MKHRIFCTWFLCLVCCSVVFATNAQPSSTPVASKWSINNLFNRGHENSRTEDAEAQSEATTTSPSPRSRTTSDKAREPQNAAIATPIGPRSRTFSNDVGRQRFDDSPSGPPFNMREENSEMMDDPAMFWNPWALWGMRYANAWQRSTRSAPWNMWYRMNPMLSFWNRFARNLANGNGYGYGEQYPGRYSGYRSDRYAPYPEPESREMYQQPAASSPYYRNQSAESSSRPPYRGQRTQEPAQPYYRNQRVEENAQSFSPSGAARVSQNYRQQSNPVSESNIRPPRNNAPTEREYREQSTNSKRAETSTPFTLLYYDDPSSKSNNVQSGTSSEYRNQRTQLNGQRERVENR